MASFYLQPHDNPEFLYELHATTDVQVTFASEVTSYPIETGSDVTDNVVMSPAEVTFKGVLTDVKQAGSYLSLSALADAITGTTPEYQITIAEYVNELRARQFNKELFYVYYSGDNAGDLEDIEIAILTSMTISKDPSLGNSWSVDVTLQEVRLASRAVLDAQPSADYATLTASNEKGSANTANGDVNEEDSWRRGAGTKYRKNELVFETNVF